LERRRNYYLWEKEVKENRLIIDGKGTEKFVRPLEQTVFVDKKPSIVDEESILRHLGEARRLSKEMAVGQRTARVELKPAHPELPVFLWLLCDSHLGSTQVDYEAFLRDYNTIKDTPNFYCLANGDEVDSFMIGMGGCSTGVYENPINPEQQALLMQKLFKNLDDQGKMLGFTFGNHNQWVRNAGYNFDNTWLRDFRCPILNCGGMFTVQVGEQEYKIAATHKYWGNSKLNITNVAKRFFDQEFPDADVSFIGHVHTKAVEQFTRAGQDKIAVVGGTYKTDDEWAGQAGIGMRNAGIGGITLALYPDVKRIVPLYKVMEAKEFFDISRELQGLTHM
jgi:hypothetical protein